jgi:hypothetical protein
MLLDKAKISAIAKWLENEIDQIVRGDDIYGLLCFRWKLTRFRQRPYAPRPRIVSQHIVDVILLLVKNLLR